MFQRTKLSHLLLAAGVVSAGPAFAASGTFTFVTGDVNVQRTNGQRVPVTRGTSVNPGDAIVTGRQGMAQLTMVDQAKISLRPNTQFQIERYAETADSAAGAVLNLVRGTLRTFTGLLSANARDRFVMKTKVATVGIRGSGNVLFAGEAADCDPEKVGQAGGTCDITVNHTIEGSHAVAFGDGGGGLPAQQGGAQTLITGPGQTVLVTGKGDVKYIPTPQFMADLAINPTGAAKDAAPSASTAETRNFGPSDANSPLTRQATDTGTPVGNNGLGFSLTDASGNLPGGDPLGLVDSVIVGIGTLFGQSLPGETQREGSALRGYSAYAGTLSTLNPAITGGTVRDVQTVTNDSLTITAGRYENATFGLLGPGTGGPVAGSVHWIYAGSGFPTYLADVLTGTATYTRVINTSPTNQFNTAGTLSTATLDVNFNNRTLNANIGIAIPAAGTNAGGSWTMTAQDVPFAFNAFFATTNDRLRITNGAGATSQGNPNLFGGFEGSFVGSGLSGAILGYNVVDQTSSNPNNFNNVSGVVGFRGPLQNAATPYRDGIVSDPANALAGELVRNYAVTNRPEEVTVDAQGRPTGFTAPYGGFAGAHNPYSIGSSTVVQSGTDAETGLTWGRWSGGVALVNAGGAQQSLSLDGRSLHYIFSGVQNGPVALPLTGQATYDLIGSTSPTDTLGHVGTLNSATLAANFTNRTVDTNVNLTIAGQTINGAANGVPIYREQYFTAFRGNTAGLPVPQQLVITCNPACPQAGGSLSGFFAGRGAEGAGMMYNLNGASGAAAFRRTGS
ncbi:MAG: FecR domain-containing protein [Betaproteobacteria bacterium]|nr:FecR domain-containing protein [Betaproteobacteria bacterium]